MLGLPGLSLGLGSSASTGPVQFGNVYVNAPGGTNATGTGATAGVPWKWILLGASVVALVAYRILRKK